MQEMKMMLINLPDIGFNMSQNVNLPDIFYKHIKTEILESVFMLQCKNRDKNAKDIVASEFDSNFTTH